MAKMLKVDIDLDSEAFTVSVRDGKKVERSEVFYMADIDDKIRERIAIQGAPTILGQRASQIKEDPDSKLDRMMEVWERWGVGEWEMERIGGTRVVAPIIEVLSNLSGKPISMIQAGWKKYPKEVHDKLIEKHKDAIEKVKAARLAQADETIDLENI